MNINEKELEIVKWIDELCIKENLVSYVKMNLNVMLSNWFFILRSYIENKDKHFKNTRELNAKSKELKS